MPALPLHQLLLNDDIVTNFLLVVSLDTIPQLFHTFQLLQFIIINLSQILLIISTLF